MSSIPFIRHRAIFYVLAAVVFIGSPLLLVFRGLELGLDFKGGTELVLQFAGPVDESEIRSRLAAVSPGSPGDVQVFRASAAGEPHRFAVRIGVAAGRAGDLGARVVKELAASPGTRTCEVLSISTIGPAVGDSLRRESWRAALWSAAGILAYMSLRFQLVPGIACTLGLVHDALLVLGFLSLARCEVDLSVIAAILSVLGYSMNDSIVVLDRVRENLRLARRLPFDELVNLSINQCLRRTVYTSLTVLLVLAFLLATGPVALRSFSLAMLVGVVSGVASTITVVCPLLVDWRAR